MRFEMVQGYGTIMSQGLEGTPRGLVPLCLDGASSWLFGLFLLIPASLASQTIPPDKDVLENAQGGGMGSYADLNGYPGPKHILDMQNKLGLSDDQLKQIEAIMDEMTEMARAKGEMIVGKEESLNGLFKSRQATEETVKRLSAQIGQLRGELRAIHLVAHIQAEQVLTKEQTAKYNAIRHKTDDTSKHEHNPH